MDGESSRAVALVTGAGRGIGLGIARALGLAGMKVALADLDADSVARSAATLRAEGCEAWDVPLDVTEAEGWARALAALTGRWGGLDVLVNNAGISPRGTAESTDEALWERTLAVNLKGPWLGIKAALPLLRRRPGTIVNIGSTRATRPMPGLFPYIVSKAGLFGLTQQVAVEYLEAGVTCNMVAPGWVDTPGERLIQAEHGRPDFPEGLRNLTTTDEIGAAVAFLASPAGRKINGIILYLDAGLHIADEAPMVYLGKSNVWGGGFRSR
jgi:NAD(P)-dependent dehydrogenase (short-subunit alcohol dehydrogenase family)